VTCAKVSVDKCISWNYILEVYLVLRCGAVAVYKHFRGALCLRLKVRRSKDGGRKFLQNVGKFLPEYVVGDISHRRVTVIVTAVSISHLIFSFNKNT